MKLQRKAIPRAGLSQGDRTFLLHGSPLGQPSRFQFKDADGEWQTDEAAAFDGWLLHRAELLAEAVERGCIPWAAREFEGMPGPISPYEDLYRNWWRTKDEGELNG